MNYIRHLTAFYEKLARDDRFNPCHISLYLALFQCWNLNHFINPVSISRDQVLKLCKIGSNHTYYKALKDLCDWGYIQYEPSFSPTKGSLIHLCIFEQDPTENEQNIKHDLCKIDIANGAKMHHDLCKNDIGNDTNNELDLCTINIGSSAKMHHERCKIDIGSGAKMHPSINNININNKTYCSEQTQNDNQILNSENMRNINLKLCHTEKTKRKNLAAKKEKAMLYPSIVEVISFFKSEYYPEVEAQKFFNHFESNGWKVGGKSPMKNWQAAARNWILNSKNFIPPKDFPKHFPIPKPSKPSPNNKNYAEPL